MGPDNRAPGPVAVLVLELEPSGAKLLFDFTHAHPVPTTRSLQRDGRTVRAGPKFYDFILVPAFGLISLAP